MALTLTAYAISQGFTLSRLAYNIPNGVATRGPIATMRAMDDTKIIVLNTVTGSTIDGVVFPTDADEQDYSTASVTSARDARSIARLDGINYVYDRSDFPSFGNEGIRLLLDTGAVPATAPIVQVLDSGETSESLVSNGSAERLYMAERIDSTHYNIIEIDPVAATKTTKYVETNRVVHIAFNGDGDRIYLATNDTAITNFRIVELTYPGFVLVESHLIGDFTDEAIICYNPPSGDSRIIAQYYTAGVSQLWDIDLSTDTPTALTSGSVNGDGMNVDPLNSRVAYITQLTEVYKLVAPVGGSFTDSVTPPDDEPLYTSPPFPTNTFAKGTRCDTDYTGRKAPTNTYTGRAC